MKKPQPAIIEVTSSQGDDEINFAIRGSSEWLDKMMPFLMFGMGTITAGLWENADEETRQDLLDGINALRALKSYQGKLVTVCIAQEQPQ